MNRLALSACIALVASCTARPDSGDAWVDAMAVEHAGETPEPTPMADASEVTRVRTERVAYLNFAPGFPGFLARPEGELRGAVVLVHEWWGLNANIEGVAERLADEGFAVLAVDLYGGVVANDAEQARQYMSMAASGGVGPTHARAASMWLRANLGVEKVAVMGFCFGGGVALDSLIEAADVFDGGIIYYGRVTDDLDRLSQIDDPLIGFFGALDEGIPIPSVRAFEAAAAEAGLTLELHVIDGADHAFANPSGQRYNADAAELAWSETLGFLDALMPAAAVADDE